MSLSRRIFLLIWPLQYIGLFFALKEKPDVLQRSKKDAEDRVRKGFGGLDVTSVQYISKTAKAIQMPILQ